MYQAVMVSNIGDDASQLDGSTVRWRRISRRRPPISLSRKTDERRAEPAIGSAV